MLPISTTAWLMMPFRETLYALLLITWNFFILVRLRHHRPRRRSACRRPPTRNRHHCDNSVAYVFQLLASCHDGHPNRIVYCPRIVATSMKREIFLPRLITGESTMQVLIKDRCRLKRTRHTQYVQHYSPGCWKLVPNCAQTWVAP